MPDDPDAQPILPEPDQQGIRQYLSERCDVEHIERRLQLENHIEKLHQREPEPLWSKIKSTRWQVNQVLKVKFLANRGRRNALALKLSSNDVYLPDLPNLLEGIKILHLSDLHIESIDGLVDRIINIIEPLHPDVTVITGDIRSRTFGSIQPSLQMMSTIRQHIHGDCFAVLGNHDSIRMVPALEAMGIQVLLNESTKLGINQQSVSILGVDDPSTYKCDNLQRALESANHSQAKPDLTILLAHSPDCIGEASRAGLDFYLCGHTHGGQICLPGGIPVHSTASSNWRYCSGSWKKAKTCGYTSRGIGTSVAPARFYCPPEITMHTLHN